LFLILRFSTSVLNLNFWNFLVSEKKFSFCLHFMNVQGYRIPDTLGYAILQLCIECPKYATTSCYHAASFHNDYVSPDGGQFTDDFRGCSPFKAQLEIFWLKNWFLTKKLLFQEDRDTYCETTNVQGLDHLNCRETCDSDNCNTAKIQKSRQWRRFYRTCHFCTTHLRIW